MLPLGSWDSRKAALGSGVVQQGRVIHPAAREMPMFTAQELQGLQAAWMGARVSFAVVSLDGWSMTGRLCPSGSPASPAASPCPSAMTNVQQGPCTLPLWCWQQKSSVSLCWLINVSWSQLPAGRGLGWHGRGSVQGDPGSASVRGIPAPGHEEGSVGAWQRALAGDRTRKISVTRPLTTSPVRQRRPVAPATPDPSGSPIQAIMPQFPHLWETVFGAVPRGQDLLPGHAGWL